MFLTRLLRGVPKYRTSKPKKQTRKFAYSKLMLPEKHLVSCPECGNPQLPTTICMQCYMPIREETLRIKQRMMMYNPYIGERQWHKRKPEAEGAG